jgi:hypothetical protein
MTMPADTVLEAEAVDLESQAAKIRLWKQGTPAPSPTPIPTPAPDASYPGARNMSSVFKKQLVMTEFPTLAAEGGAFLQAYTDWDGYPTSYQTTSKEGVLRAQERIGRRYRRRLPSAAVPTQARQREQQRQAVRHRDVPQSSTGIVTVADIVVRLPNMVPGWHINLMWPISEKLPSDGGFDFA